jgi:predicted MFS family arabinose efflux permease
MRLSVRAELGGVVEQGRERVRLALRTPRRRGVVLLAALLALNSADQATVGASATALRRGLSLSNSDIGMLLTVTGVVAAVATVPAGVLVDRVSRTRLLAVVTVFWAVVMALSATVDSYGALLACRAGLGAVTAVAGPAAASLLGDWFTIPERGRAYSWVLAGDLVGAGVGLIAAEIIASFSWRAAFAVLALPALALTWALRRLPEPDRGSTEVAPTAASDDGRARSDATADWSLLRSFKFVLSIRTNVLLIVASSLGYFFFSGVRAFGVEFTKDQYGVPQAMISIVTIVVGAAALAGVVIGGRLGDRAARRHSAASPVTIAGWAAGMASVLLLPALLTHNVIGGIAAASAAAAGVAAMNPPLDAARLGLMPPSLWGRAEAARTVVRTPVEAVAPLAFGALADNLLGGGHAGLQLTFVIMLVPLAASAAVLVYARRSFQADSVRAHRVEPAPLERRAVAPAPAAVGSPGG